MMFIKLLAISLMMSSLNAANILILAPFPTFSRWLYFEKIIDNLLANGHTMTAISPYEYSKDAPGKYFKFLISEFPIEDYYSSKDIFTGKFDSDITHLRTLYKLGIKVSEHALNDTAVKRFIKNKSAKYQLVIADHMLQDSLFLFAKKFDCPLITLGIDGFDSTMDHLMGISTPYALVPHTITRYDYKMSYMQRCYNALLYAFESAVRRFSYLPAQNKIAQKYFKEGFADGKVPDVSEVEISAILVNSHRDSPARPKLVTQVQIAGAHITKPSKVSEEIQGIYDTAKEVIYVSFGSYKPSEMPKEKLDAIIQALGETSRLVIMQLDKDMQTPANFLTNDFFPQNDILAKSKVKLFITNGGTLSVQESIKNRVPMIVIPFTGEQYRNALHVQNQKIGVMIDFDELTAELLKQKIDEAFANTAYYTNCKIIAEAFSANPVEPMQETVFWIESVIKNKGAAKYDASHLSSIQKFGYDVIAFYLAIFVTCVIFWVFTIALILKKYRQKQEKGKFKYY